MNKSRDEFMRGTPIIVTIFVPLFFVAGLIMGILACIKGEIRDGIFMIILFSAALGIVAFLFFIVIPKLWGVTIIEILEGNMETWRDGWEEDYEERMRKK